MIYAYVHFLVLEYLGYPLRIRNFKGIVRLALRFGMHPNDPKYDPCDGPGKKSIYIVILFVLNKYRPLDDVCKPSPLISN